MKALTLLELVFVIFLLSLISFMVIPKIKDQDLQVATSRLVLYLKQTRYQAMINDMYSLDDPLWHKKRWSLKFFSCNKNVEGLYYIIYSDKNKTGKIKKTHTLKDPLDKKYLYSFHTCKETKDSSKYVLLTQEFNIKEVNVSCNKTKSLGQISFGSDGRVYSRLSNKKGEHYKYEIKKPCLITLVHKNGDSRTIIVENSTGYIHEKIYKKQNFANLSQIEE